MQWKCHHEIKITIYNTPFNVTGSWIETSQKDPHYYEIIMSQLFSFALLHYEFGSDPDIRCKPKCKYWQFKQMTEIKLFSFSVLSFNALVSRHSWIYDVNKTDTVVFQFIFTKCRGGKDKGEKNVPLLSSSVIRYWFPHTCDRLSFWYMDFIASAKFNEPKL